MVLSALVVFAPIRRKIRVVNMFVIRWLMVISVIRNWY